MSLQTIPREIRHTISRDYYWDVDMVNAHPVILSYLCKKEGYKCIHLDEYISNREELLKLVVIDGKVAPRDKGKQIYLALTNGGDKDYRLIDTPSKHLRAYKEEMIQLHKSFADKNPDEFRLTKERRQDRGKDYNHEASYMNTLLCDMENTVLMEMYKFFGSPKNAVLCFDGIMLLKDSGLSEDDVSKCMIHLKDTLDINMKIKIKSMDEHLDMSKCVLKTYKYMRLEYYSDFRNLVKQDVVYKEFVEEWSDNSLKLIEDGGSMFYLTKNKK